jgi:hypothetical protein
VLFAAAYLSVPVLGHIVVLGPLASTTVGGLDAVIAGGVSALAGDRRGKTDERVLGHPQPGSRQEMSRACRPCYSGNRWPAVRDTVA